MIDAKRDHSMSENLDRPLNSLPSPKPSSSDALPSPPNGEAGHEPPGRYDANLKLIRCRLADEDRMKTKRRWKLLF